jgi:hypothetical protein
MPDARQSELAEQPLVGRCPAGQIFPLRVHPDFEQSQAEQPAERQVDLVEAQPGLAGNPAAIRLEAGAARQPHDLPVRALRANPQRFRRPMAQLLLPLGAGRVRNVLRRDVHRGLLERRARASSTMRESDWRARGGSSAKSATASNGPFPETPRRRATGLEDSCAAALRTPARQCRGPLSEHAPDPNRRTPRLTIRSRPRLGQDSGPH